MMINGINANRVAQQVAQLYSQRSQGVENGSTTGSRTGSASTWDEVQLSEEACTLQRLAAAAAAASDVDEARVEALRQQVEDGTYQVPVEALVDKLLERLPDRFG